MNDELYALFRECFPLAVREEATARRVLADPENKVFEHRTGDGTLAGAAVVCRDAILLLCVRSPYRRQGIGSRLLAQAEKAIWDAGYDEITVGAGKDYLTPGVPTSRRYYPAENEALYPTLDDSASRFFEKRGYRHSWDCNCFDMRFPLSRMPSFPAAMGGEADGVAYRWALPEEREAVVDCVRDAWSDFAQYYDDESLYLPGSRQRAMLAMAGDTVAGSLLVSLETEGVGVGSVGCTAVRPAYQGRHIAVQMVQAATAYLKDAGMTDAFLGYTYSGLDHMYGYAGYKICTYYMMAKKSRPEDA